jgi:TRAP-type uncharacterized transport system substrate-binding protein
MSLKVGLRRRMSKLLGHRGILVLMACLLFVALFFSIGYIVVPPPPDTLVMSTGIEGGTYAIFGERYRRILARERITVQLLPSSGSVENLERLKDNALRVDAGFVQDGTGSSAEAKNLVSLGAILRSGFFTGAPSLSTTSQS